MNNNIKLLFLAVTHLGFDEPLHPRVQRQRGGGDFFANYRRVLDAARKEKVDLGKHGAAPIEGSAKNHVKIKVSFSSGSCRFPGSSFLPVNDPPTPPGASP